MQEAVQKALVHYLARREPEEFLRLLDTMAGSPDYLPYSQDMAQVHALLGEAKYEQALDHLAGMTANWVLNPGFHAVKAFALHKLGREREAQAERAFYQILVEGILSTGAGSERRPYHVLRTDDEYDLLRHLGKKPDWQSLIDRGKTRLDHLGCEDGTDLWFDVSRLFAYFWRMHPGRR